MIPSSDKPQSKSDFFKQFKQFINWIDKIFLLNYYRVRQNLLLDQRNSPIDTAIYWTEYVIRHKGAYHLQSPARNLRYNLFSLS